MFNPLLPDLGKLKDADLENKVLDLTQKYYAAMRLGNGGLAQQVALNLEAHRIEQHRRQAEAMKTLQEKQKKQGLDDLINVE